MRILAQDLPDDGLAVQAGLDDAWARDAVTLALGEPPTTLAVKLTATRIGGYIRVRGWGEADAALVCDRCGGPIRIHLDGPVDLYYAPMSPAIVAEPAELQADDLDIGWYDGESLELGDVVAEQFALLAPDRIRCTDPGVEQVDGPHPCELPAAATEGPDLKPASPFAGLQLPK